MKDNFLLKHCLFFIDGEIEFKNGEFLINNTNIINKEIYQKILEIIAEINCLKGE